MKTRQLTLASVLAALVYIATLFLSIPIPTGYGYIHLGDTFVYICGIILGPFGAIPAGIGSMLADLSGPYAVYAIPTFIIKSLDACIVGYLVHRYIKSKDSVVKKTTKIGFFALVGGLIMVMGYFATEAFVLKYGIPVASANVIANLVQGVGGVIILLIIYVPLRTVIERYLY